MSPLRKNTQAALTALLLALPLLSLALNLAAWLRHGVDLPFFDDWRGLLFGWTASLDPAYLFMPLNDTMAPVGITLDALAQRLLRGNAVHYQAISLCVVLGGLLWLQWRLLRRALGDTTAAAACFVLTLAMLQPGSYWGRENMAYHQALPLLFLLAALWLVLPPAGLHPGLPRAHKPSPLRLLGVVACAVGAGLSYISGAFASAAAGLALLLLALWHPGGARRRWLLPLAWTLALTGCAMAAVQYVRAVVPMLDVHREFAPIALPHQWDFWVFLAGKLGRALVLPTQWPWAGLAVVVVVSVAALATFGRLLLLVRRHGNALDAQRWTTGLLFAALGAAVLVYLGLIAAGRTRLRAGEIQSVAEVFVFGFERFHFFWATLLWPWLAAAAWALWRHNPVIANSAPNMAWPLRTALLGLAGLFVLGGAMEHDARHRADARMRHESLACLQRELRTTWAPDIGVRCAQMIPSFFGIEIPDARPALRYAQAQGASFLDALPQPLPSLDTPVFYATQPRQATKNTRITLDIPPEHQRDLRECRLLDARWVGSAPAPGHLFFRAMGHDANGEIATNRDTAVSYVTPAAGGADWTFRIFSIRGIGPSLQLSLPEGSDNTAHMALSCALRVPEAPQAGAPS